MELNGLLTHISRDGKNPVKDKHGVNCNNGFWNEKSVIEQCGFWGLPSFINHSCFPNAKRMVVGKAMFIIAVRRIAADEEITVPYTRSLYPLVERERGLTPLGFHCVCKRCVLERSLGPSFRKLSHTINNYLQSLTKPTNISSRNLQSMEGFALQLENIEAQDEVKQLIRASFYCLYKFVFSVAKVYTDFRVLSQSLPTIMEVAEALRHAEPGCDASLKMFQMLLEEAHGKQRDLLVQKAMEHSIAIIGKQKDNVLKAFLVSKFDACIPTVRTWNPCEVYSTINI
ncbi:hypothetical protein SUGI_1091150 [Cryptomeria japonica]|uniref:uncharacterized protein LOC131859244 n=1 Tax=Cryptomeria japonica TaxID=3369 RepID=UPI002414AA8D|nr:uncharacterized protein LOC131859244 [Cryptomeria japonica]GLJ51310.1 hypothetical protein SUGI_1091150 [Cryptomeria japonica]